jgi:two-component system sensor histidine kinase ChiS
MLPPLTVLCVDDEKSILDTLQDQLRYAFAQEIQIEIAESGEEALEVAAEVEEEQGHLGLVISDYIMPGLKGDELLIQLHERFPQTRKIMLTGQSSLEAVGNSVNRAALYRYLTKPWEAEDLLLTVRSALLGFRRDKELESKILAFEKFLPRSFLNMLGVRDYEDMARSQGRERTMTILFCDIRSFTSLSEGMSAQQAFDFVNAYLAVMGPAIRTQGGVVDKYIGDGIMALFENADDGLNAALAMQDALKNFNLQRIQAFEPAISIGIGLNTGPVILGTIGESGRLQTTVLGDHVNLASRVESMTKNFEASILLTESTWNEVSRPELYRVQPLARVHVTGRKSAVMLFDLQGRMESHDSRV